MKDLAWMWLLDVREAVGLGEKEKTKKRHTHP